MPTRDIFYKIIDTAAVSIKIVHDIYGILFLYGVSIRLYGVRIMPTTGMIHSLSRTTKCTGSVHAITGQ